MTAGTTSAPAPWSGVSNTGGRYCAIWPPSHGSGCRQTTRSTTTSSSTSTRPRSKPTPTASTSFERPRTTGYRIANRLSTTCRSRRSRTTRTGWRVSRAFRYTWTRRWRCCVRGCAPTRCCLVSSCRKWCRKSPRWRRNRRQRAGSTSRSLAFPTASARRSGLACPKPASRRCAHECSPRLPPSRPFSKRTTCRPATSRLAGRAPPAARPVTPSSRASSRRRRWRRARFTRWG